jgi:hypothetical protein
MSESNLSIISSFDISSIAKEFISNEHTKEDIVWISEKNIGGKCDEWGPVSETFVLFVTTKSGGIYNYYHYLRENWFTGSELDDTYIILEKIKTRYLIKVKNFNDWKIILDKSVK